MSRSSSFSAVRTACAPNHCSAQPSIHRQAGNVAEGSVVISPRGCGTASLRASVGLSQRRANRAGRTGRRRARHRRTRAVPRPRILQRQIANRGSPAHARRRAGRPRIFRGAASAGRGLSRRPWSKTRTPTGSSTAKRTFCLRHCDDRYGDYLVMQTLSQATGTAERRCSSKS